MNIESMHININEYRAVFARKKPFFCRRNRNYTLKQPIKYIRQRKAHMTEYYKHD